jgi:hypothetical protein
MGGGLMQLVAYGAQDIYLTGNPQITFFKVVYRRHTNFSMEAIQQTWNGSELTSGGRCTATISRNGDLVHKMYLELLPSAGTNARNNPSAWGITTVEVEIGGQRIDKHSGAWMEAWAELTEPNPSALVSVVHTSAISGTNFQNMSGMGGVQDNAGTSYVYPLCVPLQFWFCRNPGLALPLIALQYHEVKVILVQDFTTAFGGITSNKLWCDYIYLDTDERRRFAQVSHEYLIEQVQEQTLSNITGTSDLNFNHPVKELIWANAGASRDGFATAGATGGSFNNGPGISAQANHVFTYQLKLNGHDRFAARDYRYFTRTQVWQHHTGCGGLDSESGSGVGQCNDGIAVYSFALKPEEHQPSGTCNFSRIDNAQLVVAGTNSGSAEADTIFAINYNVLRIMSGMGGLAYSN